MPATKDVSHAFVITGFSYDSQAKELVFSTRNSAGDKDDKSENPPVKEHELCRVFETAILVVGKDRGLASAPVTSDLAKLKSLPQ